jgi:hypothetical protein
MLEQMALRAVRMTILMKHHVTTERKAAQIIMVINNNNKLAFPGFLQNVKDDRAALRKIPVNMRDRSTNALSLLLAEATLELEKSGAHCANGAVVCITLYRHGSGADLAIAVFDDPRADDQRIAAILKSEYDRYVPGNGAKPPAPSIRLAA